MPHIPLRAKFRPTVNADGADMLCRDPLGLTPIHLAASRLGEGREAISLLLVKAQESLAELQKSDLRSMFGQGPETQSEMSELLRSSGLDSFGEMEDNLSRDDALLMRACWNT